WWREAVEGAAKRHEVAEPLSRGIAAGELDRADLLRLVDAREIEAEPSIPTLADWCGYVLASAGGVAAAAARLLGADAAEAACPFGAAYGVAGILRSVPSLARQGRCLLPDDLLSEHGLSREAVIADPAAPAVQAVLRRLAETGTEFLLSANRRFPRR